MTREEIMERLAVGFMPEPNTGCLLWAGAATEGGYGYIDTRASGVRVMHYTHRLMFEVYVEPLAEDAWVLHKCDTSLCGEPSHLYQGTQTDNMRDAALRDRIAFGERHWNAKLTEADVRQARVLWADGWLRRDIAALFGVSGATITNAVHGKSWRRVT